MFRLLPYKGFSKLLENESFEPRISWGIRLAVAATVPLIWGLATGHVIQAVWITLVAECICWIELKGSYTWRLGVLLSSAVLSLLFAVFGTITGDSILFSVLGMLLVGFISGLFKNLGDRGSALSICVYLLFIICNAYPAHTLPAVYNRAVLIAIGAAWTIGVSLVIALFMPDAQPYRRQIALIWRNIAALMDTVSKGWDPDEQRSGLRDIYLKEKDVRAALDSSYQFYESMAHQVSEKEKSEYQLAQLRKSTSLVAVAITAMSEEMETLNIKDIERQQRVKLASLFRTVKQTTERMATLVMSIKPEDALLTKSRINKLRKLIALIKETPVTDKPEQQRAINRILQLVERSIKLIESSMERLDIMGKDKPVYRSYSLIKSLFVLHPKYLIKNIGILFNFNTFTTRYALRTALAATLGMAIFKWFKIDHGYWLPFSVMIIIQPYFGATFKKAIDRIAGTLLGGLTGGLLLRIPTSLHLQEAILFITFILMVYYLRKNYAIAAYVITINLVLLFNIEGPIDDKLIITRALCTIGGGILAVTAGFALLPTWDRKLLPKYLTEAVSCNYQYLLNTFFAGKINVNWTRSKRNVESKNSNVFDSLNRYQQEPKAQSNAPLYYELITHNVRITRNLNNINLEQEQAKTFSTTSIDQQTRIIEALVRFNEVMETIKSVNPDINTQLHAVDTDYKIPFLLNDTQMMYLDKLVIELKTMQQDLNGLPEALK